MKVDLEAIEEMAKLLYIRALKVLPDDIKDGLNTWLGAGIVLKSAIAALLAGAANGQQDFG
ncbi:MAG: hypothetical protein V3R37_08700 [Rhodospirillales bacterium]